MEAYYVQNNYYRIKRPGHEILCIYIPILDYMYYILDRKIANSKKNG